MKNYINKIMFVIDLWLLLLAGINFGLYFSIDGLKLFSLIVLIILSSLFLLSNVIASIYKAYVMHNLEKYDQLAYFRR